MINLVTSTLYENYVMNFLMNNLKTFKTNQKFFSVLENCNNYKGLKIN